MTGNTKAATNRMNSMNPPNSKCLIIRMTQASDKSVATYQVTKEMRINNLSSKSFMCVMSETRGPVTAKPPTPG